MKADYPIKRERSEFIFVVAVPMLRRLDVILFYFVNKNKNRFASMINFDCEVNFLGCSFVQPRFKISIILLWLLTLTDNKN